MADVILDAVFEVVKLALSQNNMLEEISPLRDYANFQLILKLKAWTQLNIENESETEKSGNSCFDADVKCFDGLEALDQRDGTVAVKQENLDNSGAGAGGVCQTPIEKKLLEIEDDAPSSRGHSPSPLENCSSLEVKVNDSLSRHCTSEVESSSVSLSKVLSEKVMTGAKRTRITREKVMENLATKKPHKRIKRSKKEKKIDTGKNKAMKTQKAIVVVKKIGADVAKSLSVKSQLAKSRPLEPRSMAMESRLKDPAHGGLNDCEIDA